MSRPITLFVATAIAFSTVLHQGPATADIVHDPWNYKQAVLTAARTLDQVRHQVTSLQNEATMLANEARNLASLPYSALTTLQQSIGETQQLLNAAQRLAYDVAEIESTFAGRYGEAASTGPISDIVSSARERWRTSVAAFEDALKTQATAVGNLGRSRAEMERLVNRSQGASGALQVAQAGNQLLALQTQQLADLTAILSAQGRATALEQARIASAEAAADERLRRFLAPARGYTPTPVSMFQD